MSMFLIFAAAFAAWLILRIQLVLTEWQTRSMWIASVSIGGLLLFTGTPTLLELATNVIWPLCGGLMASEMVWQRYAPRFSFLRPEANLAPAPKEQAPRKKKKRKKRPPTL